METKFTLNFVNAKVIKSVNADSPITIRKTKSGDEYASLLLADLKTGAIIFATCFDEMRDKVLNMKLVANEDTVSGTGFMKVQQKKDENGKIYPVIYVKIVDINYGPNLQNWHNEDAVSKGLNNTKVFNGNVPTGKAFG